MHEAIKHISQRRKEAKQQLTELIYAALTQHKEQDVDFLKGFFMEEEVCVSLDLNQIRECNKERNTFRRIWKWIKNLYS